MGRRTPTPTCSPTLQAWWEPLLAHGPDACARASARRACCRAPATSRSSSTSPPARCAPTPASRYGFRFDIARPLVETVVAERAVDWSNSLFLSCRFRAWREGEFNEYVYNFFKSLSPGGCAAPRPRRCASSHPPTETEPDIELGGWVVQRRCPHRNADLAVFGEIDGCELTCTLHGWRFDLETGECLTAADHPLRVAPPGRLICGPDDRGAGARRTVVAPWTQTGMSIGMQVRRPR